MSRLSAVNSTDRNFTREKLVKMIRMVEEEKLSYRIVAKRLDLSENTVLEIMKRHRHANTTQPERQSLLALRSSEPGSHPA